MARDTFVLWKGAPPTTEQVGFSLRGYMHDIGTVSWSGRGERWMASLPGHPEPDPCGQEERWFEVCLSPESADVITRSADEFTNAVAIGFARRIARQFKGQVDIDGAQP